VNKKLNDVRRQRMQEMGSIFFSIAFQSTRKIRFSDFWRDSIASAVGAMLVSTAWRDFRLVEQFHSPLLHLDFYGHIPYDTVMSTILSLRLPASIHKQLVAYAEQDGVSMNQFIATAIAEKLASLATVEYLEQRAQNGSRDKFNAVLSKVPDSKPVGDELDVDSGT